MSGKVKKLKILKMKPKVGLEYSDKTSYFELKLFSSASRKFSVSFTTTFQGIWEVRLASSLRR
eukprot:UN01297